MAFPVVQAIAEDADTSSISNHVLDIPSGSVGDLLLLIVARSGNIGLSLSGWTEMLDEVVTNGLAIWARTADGTEGATVTVLGGNQKVASICYRISGAEAMSTQQPTIGTVGTGTSNAPDPDNCNPGAAKDYLWITTFAQAGEEADDDTWCNNAATNYGNLLQKTSGTGGVANTNVSLASCERTNNASSEDAAWPTGTTDQSLAWRAVTIAIHPAAPVIPFPRRAPHQAIRPMPHQLEVPRFNAVQ